MKKELIALLTGALLLIINLNGCVEEIPSVELNTIYVDDDGSVEFTRIQNAIDEAFEGDTVFVNNGTYNEVLIINKSINLIGESRDNTVIEFNKNGDTSQENIVFIDAENCTIKEFKILGDGSYSEVKGINVNASNCTVSDNIILNNSKGINIGEYTNNSYVSSNIVSDNLYGITLYSSNNNNISKNNISSSVFDGILLHQSDYNLVFGNIVSDNGFHGIRVKASEQNTIFDNLAFMNEVGIYCCCGSLYNIIYYNSFKENSKLNGRDLLKNQWDNGIVGNYWDDYNGTDADGDGIGDTPYNISGDRNVDRYPLMNPVSDFST